MSDARAITAGALISAERVRGTDVFDAAGAKLGTVDDVMLDKASGQAVYAVVVSGGFLGVGGTHRPLPWAALSYDGVSGGYVVHLDKAKLDAAPGYGTSPDFDWTADYARSVDDYYKLTGQAP